MTIDGGMRKELEAIIRDAYGVSQDVGKQVEEILNLGQEQPLSREEAFRLLTKVVTVLKGGTGEQVAKTVQRVLEARAQLGNKNEGQGKLVLKDYNGISVKAVKPTPTFHGRDVEVRSGFVKLTDIKLWDENDRLELHLGHFRKQNGRKPTPEELLDIMLSEMQLPGLDKQNEFQIVELARSIAVNGVRKPPILDVDGTLLDGNRRVAACYFILNSEDFDSSQKRRVETLHVWQLTEFATDDDRHAVVVSLNFESDCKQDWPEYVKAQKIYEEWQTMLQVEPQTPGIRRLADMKRELSMRYALGPETNTVGRYLKMVGWALDFEDYHIQKKSRDEYEVKHRASHYFQYFDELGKGEQNGVAYVLKNNEAYRHLVFDLLYQGKFKNWRQIRDLKHVHENEEALEYMRKARETADEDEAEEYIDEAITVAKIRSADFRTVGANTRIEVFVKWLEELPVGSFRDHIKKENLQRLLDALKLVERQANAVLNSEPNGKVQA